MPDRGPIYTETLLHAQRAPDAWLVEPYNAASATLFIAVALYWLIKVAGRQQPFLTYAAVVLAVGGVGGTLYHALRTHVLFLVLDVVPILTLAVSAVYWFVERLAKSRWTAFAYTVGGLMGIFALIRTLRIIMPGPVRGPVVGYGTLALFVIVPMLIFVVRTRFQHAYLVFVAIGAFALGMWFRAIDRTDFLPIGTHFLWHTLGAVMTHLLLLYLWRMRDAAITT